MPSNDLRVSTDDGIRTITLNRPEARNALSVTMRRQLKVLFGEAASDDDVAVVVVTGADPAFCGGVDIKEIRAGGGREGEITDPAAALRAIPKPVIGAINGVCVTGGLELALGCDILIASDRARFADTHVRIGFVPAWGMSVFLAQAVGTRKAIELSLTGEFIDADEALRIGLVNHVVPHDELLPRTNEMAATIRDGVPDPSRTVLEIYRQSAGLPVADALAIERAAFDAWRARGGSA